MADYFEEMGWQPLAQGQTPNHFIHIARLLRDFGMWQELEFMRMFQDGERPPPPASKEAVQNLKEETIKKEGEKCPVCLKEYAVGEVVKEMPCKHQFHDACILPWLEKTNSCPLCRHELPTDDEDYEMYKKEKSRSSAREAEIEILHNSMFS